jgi:hypothetical protein
MQRTTSVRIDIKAVRRKNAMTPPTTLKRASTETSVNERNRKENYENGPRERRVVVVAAALAALITPLSADAEGLEIETNLVQRMTGYGYSLIGASTGGGARIGLSLGRRSVLMTGLDLAGSGETGGIYKNESYSFHVPLELKLYLREPTAKRLVPSLRIGVGYGRSSSVDGANDLDYAAHSIEGLASGGLSYFFTPQVAVSTAADVVYSRSYVWGSFYGDDSDQGFWNLSVSWRLGLLFRV